MTDNFRGDNAKLVESIKALLALDESGSLVPHGVGGHARQLLSAAASRLSASIADTAGAKPIYQVQDPCEATWEDTDWLTYKSTDGAFARIVYAAPPVTPSDKQDELGPFRHKCRSCGGIFGARHWKPICSTCRANATSIDKQEASMTRAGIACLQRYAFRPNTRMNSLEKDSEGSWLRYSDVVRVVEGAIKKDPK
jgi:hypothetical protein